CPASPASDPPQSHRTAPPTGGGRRPSVPGDPPQMAQLIQEISEAELWVRGKRQDLGDQDDDCSARSIDGDIRGFQVTMMKLNQMSDHLLRSETPSADNIRTQLQSLKDQWQLLKNTATNHSKLGGGANALQEFNKKADELEMWMREKEEIPPLSLLLDENLDKVQLSRRILDLKQEQLYYSNLQENINSLAQKLEKHGRAESRGTSNRRKHLNRMWLRLQGSLDEYQRSLQLALEGASLWQQVDTVLRAMQEKRDAASCNGHGDQDLRDIAGQIMMLDVSVSQVSSLHPVLASRALHRQRQVKEIWSQLQQTVRTGKSSRGTTFTREPGNSATPDTREQSSVGKQQQSIPGSQTIVSQKEPNSGDSNVQIPLHPATQAGPSRCGKLLQCREESDIIKDHCLRHSQSPDAEEEVLLSELKATSEWLQNLEQLLSEPAAMRSPELVRRDLRQVSYLEKQVKSRGVAMHSTGRAVRSSGRSVDEEMQVQVREVEERLQTVQEGLRRRASDLRDTLVLSEFMKVVQLEEERRRRNSPLREPPDPPPELAHRKEVFTPLEELQEAVEMLNDAAMELAANKETTDLERRLLAFSHMIQSASALTQDVRRKMEEVEQNYIAAKKHVELRDLQEISGLHQQAEAEVTGEMQAEVRSLEEQRNRLQELCPQRSQVLGRSIEEALQAWAQLQEDIQRNRAQLHRTSQLREFFLSYLGMISWTEETRAQILSDSPEDRLSLAWREGLERSIDGKMKEFEVLAGIGWKLIGEDRLLTQMEEAQPAHRPVKSDKFECPVDEDTPPTAPPPRGPARRRYRRKALSPMLFQQPLRLSGGTDNEDGAELLEDAPGKCALGPLWLEPKVLPTGTGMEEEQEEEEETLMVTRKLDYQLMEGSLEKKHILQSGGRKASSRTWGVFYTVLVRRTLCFYHDRKHSTKSPVSAPPLDLTGALCTPELDYTKRSNCFRLRLRDGSEYLFRAPTCELLQEWMCKLRHNSGIEDTDPLREPPLGFDRSPHLASRGRPLNSCTADLGQPVPVRGRDPAEHRSEPHPEPFGVSAGGCRADTRQVRSRVPDNIPKFADSEFDVSLTASRRRSRSFSS
ncbi:PREDICTED: spectrin beta chain, non-erythrocytic 5-like, partial [Nanorana parkeri]|uniref:spectrin beta chain, non-erythrocytic 5-like n=1 Tax=Nanorana parkeri TaxID=125878 RepID=UPI0008546C0A